MLGGKSWDRCLGILSRKGPYVLGFLEHQKLTKRAGEKILWLTLLEFFWVLHDSRPKRDAATGRFRPLNEAAGTRYEND
jgi:hypothetical protein